MADGLVQHHAGPARAEHHVHFAGRRRHRFEIHQRLAHRVVDRVLPARGVEEGLKAFASAIAVAAGFLPVAIAGDDRDVDTHQRAHVAVAFAVGAQNLDHLPGGTERDRDLPHARVLGTRIGVDRLEQTHLGFEGGPRELQPIDERADAARRELGRSRQQKPLDHLGGLTFAFKFRRRHNNIIGLKIAMDHALPMSDSHT